MTDFPIVRLKYACCIEMGQSPPSSSYGTPGDELPFLQGNAEFGQLHPQARHGCDAAPKRCRPGDLLFSVRAPVGATNVADRVFGIGRGLCAISAGEEVDARFLWYLSPVLARELRALAVGSTYDAVAVEDVANARIPLPSLDEQRSIAAFLEDEVGRLDELVGWKRRLLALLEERRCAVVRSGVSGELIKNGTRTNANLPWLERVPTGWRIAKLTHVARLGTGHTPDRRNPEFWVDCTIPWITTSDIEQIRDDRLEVITDTREQISELGLANSSAVLHPGATVVLSRTASVGFSAIMGRDMATSQDFVTWTCSDEVEPRFLLLCLRAMRADLVGRLAMGSTHQTIYMPDVEALRIPLPAIDEQRAIITACTEALARIHHLAQSVERQLPLLSERRQTLITAAVTGQIDPTSYRRTAVAA